MRVLQLVQGLDIGNTYGGAERAGAELARQLRRDGHAVTLCAFWRYHTAAEAHWHQSLEADGVRVLFATDRTQSQSPQEFARGVRNIRRTLDAPVDVAHAHHDGGALAALILKSRKQARVTVHTMHSTIDKQWGTTRVGWLCRHVFTYALFPLLLDAETSIAPHYCEALAQRPVVLWLHRQARLTYTPVPFRFSAENHSLRPTTARADTVIGSVARLDAFKGHRYLIEAFSMISSAFPRTRLLLVGDGAERAALQQQAGALGVRERVEFAGQRDDLSACYGQMDLFVLPSLLEGMPTVVLESIASGVPVITTDLPGTRMLIEDGISGWLVPPANASALAEAIADALTHPARAAERACCARGVLKDFSIGATGSRYAALYHRLLAP